MPAKKLDKHFSPFVLLGVSTVLAATTLLLNRTFSPTPVDVRDLGHVIGRIADITGMSGPWFWTGVGAILLLERWRPAVSAQRVLSSALAYDFVWLLIDVVTRSGILLAFMAMLENLYADHLSFLTLELAEDLPLMARFLLAFALFDFLAWAHHWIRHRVRWFWYFHALHHSQRELNLFTDLRYHTVEYLITAAIALIPSHMLGFGMPGAAVITVARMWHTRFYHANIRTNLGPLRFLFITPQSHRIHHSPSMEHRDRNFGVTLSIWDRMLGTHYEANGEYPLTGLADDEFPIEQGRRGLAHLAAPVEQWLYPFRMIWSDLRRLVDSPMRSPH